MRVVVKNKSDMAKCLKAVTDLDLSKTHVVEIKELRPARSVRQNNLMWMWFRCIGDELGYTADEVHDVMVAKHLGITEKEVMKTVLYNRQSTSDLDTAEMTEFLDNVNHEAINLNIYLPIPGMEGWDEFYGKYG